MIGWIFWFILMYLCFRWGKWIGRVYQERNLPMWEQLSMAIGGALVVTHFGMALGKLVN